RGGTAVRRGDGARPDRGLPRGGAGAPGRRLRPRARSRHPYRAAAGHRRLRDLGARAPGLGGGQAAEGALATLTHEATIRPDSGGGPPMAATLGRQDAPAGMLGLRRVVAADEAARERMVAAAVEAIWTQVAAYRESADQQLRDEVTKTVRAMYEALVTSVEEA